MATYGIEDEPTFVSDDGGAPLPGHYEATFLTPDGERALRFLTDKGRAEILRVMEEGRRALTETEVEELTVEPDLDALIRRMDREGGEGA